MTSCLRSGQGWGQRCLLGAVAPEASLERRELILSDHRIRAEIPTPTYLKIPLHCPPWSTCKKQEESSLPEGKDFVEVIEYLMDPRNKEKLQHLLSDEAWKRFVAATKLSRDVADALYEDLSQLEALMAMEDKDMSSADQMNMDTFMKAFPQVKQDLEECIGKLYALADEVAKVHKDCTITQVAASSTGIVSGILTIVGLSLAPVTAGASLVLWATGVGLGAAASVTSVTAGIVDFTKKKSAKAKASRLVSTGNDTGNLVMEDLHHNSFKIGLLLKKCSQSLVGILENCQAFKLAKSTPLFAAEATSVIRTGAISGQSSKQLQKAFGSTALTMSKGARIAGIATAGFFLLVDVIQLVRESKHLHEGAKAQSAEELRKQAQELESMLKEITCIHKSLQEELTLFMQM
ncbi:Apolipoprotein L3 [Myotis davidii]|uniref:Apolipoprotein L3 n=1 Tax=Myotis davidii TaxID=225400 RepID=L5LLY0_MYODS|nr:Apolipoprotein L3 [Myotis davidii]